MVTRETSYIGQLYFGLSTDDAADVAEWHNGDRILLMDVDKMMVYDDETFNFHEIPMGGGGGGGGGGEPAPNTYALTIVNNKSSGTATQKRIAARNLIEKASDQWYLASKNISGGATADVTLLAPLINQYGVAGGYLMISAKTASAFAFNDASLASLYGSFTDGTGAYIYLIAIKDTNAVTVTVTDA